MKDALKYAVQNEKYQLIDANTLCACSALPYIEGTVRFEDGTEYCAGALVDTVNFRDLIEDHEDLKEIWVSKIVDFEQISAPRNVSDALGNLSMLYPAAGDDDIKLFKYHARLDREEPWLGEIIELDFGGHTNFNWNHDNFDKGVEFGRQAAKEALRKYKSGYFKEKAYEDRKRWRRALEQASVKERARVINSCFVTDQNLLSPRQSLVCGQVYSLRLQVVPEHFLEPFYEAGGLDLDVSVYSDDFAPLEGTSFPRTKLRLPDMGPSDPIEIALRAPAEPRQARLRACTYYQQNIS